MATDNQPNCETCIHENKDCEEVTKQGKAKYKCWGYKPKPETTSTPVNPETLEETIEQSIRSNAFESVEKFGDITCALCVCDPHKTTIQILQAIHAAGFRKEPTTVEEIAQCWADTFKMFQEAGYVKLAKNQELPVNNRTYFTYQQIELLDTPHDNGDGTLAGWKKVTWRKE